MEKISFLLMILFALAVHYGQSAPAPDPGLAESVYGAPVKKRSENSIEKAPVASAQHAAPQAYSQHQHQQLEQQKEQLKQLKVKQLEQQEIQKQHVKPESPKPQPQPPAQHYQAPQLPPQQVQLDSSYNPSYLPTPTISNHLDDYPPKDRLDALSGYLNTPNTPQYFPPVHPGLYRGYPYMYGYPLEMRYGYAYGHAFTTDGE